MTGVPAEESFGQGFAPPPDRTPGPRFGQLGPLLRGAWRSLAGARCRVCGLVTSGPGLCEACAKELRPRLTDYCPGCGALCESAGQPPALCGACRQSPRPWTGMAFYAEYGGPLRQAILESGAVRFRPIFLTAGAAMLGAWPITRDPIFSGLAWSLIFGLFVSTAFTLVVIPTVYAMIYAPKPVRVEGSAAGKD
jgi:hypothetical protein